MGVPGITEVVLLLVWLGFAAAGIVGWVVFLVAVWRTMRAHESIADSAREVISILNSKQRAQ